MDDPEFDRSGDWQAASAAQPPVFTDARSVYDEYADEFALNDIGLALRFSSPDR